MAKTGAPPLSQLYLFNERRFTAFTHSIRVYIHGVDVSAWLKSEVSITYANRDSYNTASFNLANPMLGDPYIGPTKYGNIEPRGLWQISQRNLDGFWFGREEFDETAKKKLFDLKASDNQSETFTLDVTQASLASVRKTQKASTSNKDAYQGPNGTQERKYRLAVNDCIFNKNDYVRIFVANPLAPIGDEWMEVFCGFVQEHPITTNTITGESTLRISCSCIKQQLTRMRVQTNVHLGDIDPQFVSDKGFYQDFISPTIASHPFAQSSLEDTIKALILGSMVPGREGQEAAQQKRKSRELRTKVGDFKLGNVICYDPQNPGNTLECWHLMTLFGVNKKTFPVGGAEDDLWLTYREMDLIGRSTMPGGDKICGTPVSRYLHFLIPAGGTGAGSLMQYNVISGAGAQARDWTTRWDVIRDFASKLDFQVMTSPSGDILVEFPQYGFTPCAYMNSFGNSKAAPNIAQGAIKAAKDAFDNPLAGNNEPKSSPKAFPQCADTTGSLASIFVFSRHEKEGTLNDEAEDFPTVLMVSGGMAPQPLGIGNIEEVLAPRAYVYCPQLVHRFGIITETVDFPFAGQAGGDINDKTGAGGANSPLVRRLGQLGLIEYTKRMANASTWQGSLVYRPFLFPNRPIHLVRSARIGSITSVTHTWHIGKEATTNCGVNMLMARRADGSYRLLTGSVNTPIDYGAIWGGRDQGAAGVTIDPSKIVGPPKDDPIPQAIDSGVRVETGSAKQADQSAKNETPSTGNKFNDLLSEYSANGNLDALFPPFRTLVERLLTKAKSMGLNPKVSSTYRSAALQADIKANPEKYPVSAEPYLSMHNYGLAVDITVPGSQGVKDRASLDPLGAANNAANTGLVWGGNFPSYDGVHFQVPSQWMETWKARSIVNLLLGQGVSEPEAIQQVWNAIYAKIPQLTELGDRNGIVPPPENLDDLVKEAAAHPGTENLPYPSNGPAAPGTGSTPDKLNSFNFGIVGTPSTCNSDDEGSKLLDTPGLKVQI